MAIPRNDFNRLTTYNFENVFDVEKLAKFYAILDLTGQEHAVYTTNTRYYYNPITSLLEPIGFDHSSIEILHRPLAIYKDFWNDTYKFDHLYEQLFANREFFRRYVEIADKLTRQECCLDEFFSKIADTAKRKLSILQVDRPGYHAAVKQKLYINRKLIREFLFSGKNIKVKFENYDQVNNLVTLRIFNNGLMPMEIEDLFVIDGIKIPPAPNIKGNIIKGHFSKDANQGTSFNFLLPIQFNWQAISRGKAVVRYKPFGTDIAQETDIVVHTSQEEEVVDKWNAIQRYKNIESVEFLKINETEKTIVIKPGNWTLTKDLLIPKGYRLIGRGEIRLNLLKSSKITSFSPVEIVGEKDRDIVIYSEDGTGQGLAVINASQQSLLNHVIFRNLSEPVSMDRNLTGAITFYRSPLKIQKVHFRETRSEDALHVIDSNLDMNTVSFSNISSDAIDCDFCNIELFNVTFRDIGNDAIDVSGSKGHLKSIEIKNVQDKGISIGEGSNIVVHTLTVAGADIGLASKDSSVVAADRVSVEDSHIGFAVYTKKPEYGPARLSLSNVKMSNVEEHYYIQVNSDVLLDGKIKDDFEYKTDKYDKSSS